MKSFLGNFYRHLAIFFWSLWCQYEINPRIFSQKGNFVVWKFLRTNMQGSVLTNCFFSKWTDTGSFLFIFVHFTFQFKWQIYNLSFINWKTLDGVLGTWTWGGRMEGVDQSTSYRLTERLFNRTHTCAEANSDHISHKEWISISVFRSFVRVRNFSDSHFHFLFEARFYFHCRRPGWLAGWMWQHNWTPLPYLTNVPRLAY